MALLKRHRTKYPGVYYIFGTGTTGKPERIYYIRYRREGKQIEEKAGRQFKDDMTPARAAIIRTQRIEGNQLSNEATRRAKQDDKELLEQRWTIDRLWNEYRSQRAPSPNLKIDSGRYEKYLQAKFGNKEPNEIIQLEVDRLRVNLSKKLAPQSVKHILTLLERIANFGYKGGLTDALPFKVKKPQVNNLQTEDLNPDQLNRLLEAIEKDDHLQAGPLMKLALYSGMRRGELLKLKWEHIDFERGFINIVDPKGGPDQRIPLNYAVRSLLNSHHRSKSAFVFPGRAGKQRKSINREVNRIKNSAGLPKDFRPLHGLRHAYASMLASSGQVDMYTLQKLLTHKSPVMTQRYAHLRDEVFKRAAELAGEIIDGAVIEDPEKVVKINHLSEGN